MFKVNNLYQIYVIQLAMLLLFILKDNPEINNKLRVATVTIGISYFKHKAIL